MISLTFAGKIAATVFVVGALLFLAVCIVDFIWGDVPPTPPAQEPQP